MDLNLTPEETKFRDELRTWLEANVPKDWGEWREKPLEESFPYLRAWQRKLYEGGWAAVSWPKEYGGRGATLMEQSLFWEEMARAEARLDGDHYVVNGQKVWTSYGWIGNWCELVVRTDPNVPKHKGLSVLLIDMKSPGVEVRPLR